MAYYLGYEFTKAVAQKAAAIPSTATATDTFTSTAHGLVAGQAVVLTSIGSMTNVVAGGTYYVISPAANTFKIAATVGGSAITVGTGTPTVTAITEVELEWPNQISPSPETKTYQWEGGGAVEKLEALVGMTLDLSLDCIPYSAHRTIFSKSQIATTQPGGITNGTGFGGGNDRAGVSIGLRLEGNANKDVSGVRTTVKFAYWLPVGTLTLKSPPALQSGAKFERLGYGFSAVKTLVNIAGGTIPNISSDGEFFIVGEI